ncbi:2-hydroxyacid dehydrogenase [Denitrobaculum tricleocarpae]|uniref:Glyoxylate/hydroxypyruvate reductase A n=1 Tax=Denitrobaculum tricleocarpae TaxID=2591009 RepID=A0A545U184_9PROT|nr:glyoxylate/hydroxypyruvate reductase A [Denitrobaculum tricleocarpae]TQV83247.1 glyoxylate/hydroxypyruvate reductase A [Denitrobaculum tricleocarpae]
MALLFKSDTDRADIWQDAIAKLMPDLEFRIWPEIGEPADIEYALIWNPPKGALSKLPNLKVIFSMGAGIDHLASDPDLPANVPVVRMVDEGLTLGMTEFVVMAVLRHHRRIHDYEIQQRQKRWEQIVTPLAPDRKVGILGLGVLGSDAAEKLAYLGFDVAGWSRTQKNLPGIECFSGEEGLRTFLRRTEILVCLLPLTESTKGILKAENLNLLPQGACLINVARGGHMIPEDVLAALDSGQLAAATLDVFPEEPLPESSPFWQHSKVLVIPHCASVTLPTTAAAKVVEGIEAARSGKPLQNVVDFERGY